MRQTAFDRLDTWVLLGSLAFLVLCIVGLVLLHLFGRLTGQFRRRGKAVRESPEPPRSGASAARPEARDDPERLQQACAAMEGSLADLYLKLGESRLRKGQHSEATSQFEKLVRTFPDLPQAVTAREHLRQIRTSSAAIQSAPTGEPL